MLIKIKMFNLRFTGEHSKTGKDVKKLSEKYKVIIAAYEDIAWQNMKPEKAHVHVLIETEETTHKVKKYINDVLHYKGNEEYKIGRPVKEDEVERVIQYACKGRTLGDITNVETTEIDIEKIKLYNQSFWEEKIENDDKYKKKNDSIKSQVIKMIMDPKEITNNHGVLDLYMMFQKIVKIYTDKNMPHSKYVINNYINMACAIWDNDNYIKRLVDDYTRFHDVNMPQIRPADYEIKNASEKIDKYINKVKTGEDADGLY